MEEKTDTAPSGAYSLIVVVFLLAAIGCTVLTVAFLVTFPDSWPSSSPMVPTALLILLTALVNLKVWKDRSFRPQLGRE